MSLWTPGGEVPIERRPPEPRPDPAATPTPPPAAESGVSAMIGGPDLDDLSPEERARAEEFIAQMAEAQRQIAATPVTELIANHLMGFYELAAIKLGQQPPLLGEAQVAIDALAAVLEAVGDHLGDHRQDLRQALTNLQMAFVQLQRAGEAPDGPDPAG